MAEGKVTKAAADLVQQAAGLEFAVVQKNRYVLTPIFVSRVNGVCLGPVLTRGSDQMVIWADNAKHAEQQAMLITEIADAVGGCAGDAMKRVEMICKKYNLETRNGDTVLCD